MDTIVHLFHDHPLFAVASCAFLLMITVLPIAGKRFPRLILRMGTSIVRIVSVPFSFWRRTVLDLAARSGGMNDAGATPLSRRLLPVMQSVLLLGGVLILTAGFLAGWRASGFTREAGHVKAALRTELPLLESALADARTKIAILDREWAESGACHREEHLNDLFAEARRLSDENAVLHDFLSRDRQTQEVFAVLAGDQAGGEITGETAAGLRGALPALGLSREKEWLITRYLENLAREGEVVRGVEGLTDAGVRRVHQPEIEMLRSLEAELVPSIAQVRAGLAAPDEPRTFDPTAFVAASWSSLFLFCGFIWVVGGLIELMGSAVTLRRPVHATVNEAGCLNWAE